MNLKDYNIDAYIKHWRNQILKESVYGMGDGIDDNPYLDDEYRDNYEEIAKATYKRWDQEKREEDDEEEAKEQYEKEYQQKLKKLDWSEVAYLLMEFIVGFGDQYVDKIFKKVDVISTVPVEDFDKSSLNAAWFMVRELCLKAKDGKIKAIKDSK